MTESSRPETTDFRFGSPLPIDAWLPRIVDTLKVHRKIVIQAAPGAGKTTRVPIAIANSGLLNGGRLMMLEPRRVAARVCATYMAQHYGETPGKTVGYQVRFDQRMGPKTRIVVVTEGVMTRRIIDDPLLEGIAGVIIDEFHERSINADLSLAFLKEIMSVREDLLLVVMSATMDTVEVSRFLGNCPIMDVPGRHHPLHVLHVAPARSGRVDSADVLRGVRRALEVAHGGDVLVFLPGVGEIEQVSAALRVANIAQMQVVSLHGRMPRDAQDRVLRPGRTRRIVLATNIAETALTIPGVEAVVDTGYVKQMRYDGDGQGRLEMVTASMRSAQQRGGRAGRLGPGVVVRLWTQANEKSRPVEDVPEIRRGDPASYLLQILSFAPGPSHSVSLLTAPSNDMIESGAHLLRLLGALEPDRLVLTKMGKQMAALPLHPRAAAIFVVGVNRGTPLRGAMLAALLSCPDILVDATAVDVADRCDMRYREELFLRSIREHASRHAAGGGQINNYRVREVALLQEQLLRGLPRSPAENETMEDHGVNLLVAGYPDRVCRLDETRPQSGKLANGKGVQFEIDMKAEGPFHVVLEERLGPPGVHRRRQVSLSSPVRETDLEILFPHLVTQCLDAVFDPVSEAVRGHRVKRFLRLELERPKECAVDAETSQATLFDAAARQFSRFFPMTGPDGAFFNRLIYATRVYPDAMIPSVTQEGLLSLLKEQCSHCRCLQQLDKLDWRKIVWKKMDYPTRQCLDETLPSAITLPTGTRVEIDYGEGAKPGKTPQIAARLQQFLGAASTPTILRGQIALTVVLLSPAGRPLQVTRDLESFWNNGYDAVRKEMRSRYPKHPWPKDPLLASPTRFASKHRQSPFGT